MNKKTFVISFVLGWIVLASVGQYFPGSELLKVTHPAVNVVILMPGTNDTGGVFGLFSTNYAVIGANSAVIIDPACFPDATYAGGKPWQFNGTGNLTWNGFSLTWAGAGSLASLVTTGTVNATNGFNVGATSVIDSNGKYLPKVLFSSSVSVGSLLTNNEASPASFIACTNYGDMLAFTDGATNQCHLILWPPAQWDAGTISIELESLCTGTNASLGGQTNFVYANSAGTVTNYGLVTSITYGADVWTTNHIGTNSYAPGKTVTAAITVGGGSVTATNPVSILIKRLGGQTGDTVTNTSAGLVGAIRVNWLCYITNSALPSATQ